MPQPFQHPGKHSDIHRADIPRGDATYVDACPEHVHLVVYDASGKPLVNCAFQPAMAIEMGQNMIDNAKALLGVVGQA